MQKKKIFPRIAQIPNESVLFLHDLEFNTLISVISVI